MARTKADLQGALESSAALWKLSFERAVANAMAGLSHLMHGHLDNIAKQIDPTKADEDILVSVHATPYGVNRKQAVPAQLRLSATGANGTPVATNRVFTRADGQRYTVDAPGATVSGGSVTFTVTAQVPGQLGNSPNSTPLQQGSPIAGLNDDATVVATLVDGADLESPEDLLPRVLDRRRSPPKGGAPGDYRGWMLEVAGVTRAWEYPRLEGAGTVTLYGVNDNSGVDPITLSPSKLTEAATYLDQPGRQPTQATAFVRTPTLQPIPMTIRISPDTPENRAAALLELDEVYRRNSHPGGMTVLWSELNEALSISPGEVDHTLINPPGDVSVNFGQIAVRGAVTWV
jgi:uncharacterized phage protein gp47/JayE